MDKLRERIRFHIANLVDRLPGQCWADLVGWAMRDNRDDPDWRSEIPWRPIGPTCRSDLARVGSCYCGKLRAEAAAVVDPAEAASK